VKIRHHDLIVWKEAIQIVKEIYKTTSTFPHQEVYGLTSQICRSAVSIPSNIAEGAARTSPKEFLKFLSIARGSLMELETQLILAKGIGYLAENNELFQKIEKIFSLLSGLMRSVKVQDNK
jgi:four helix bundle protein